MDNESLLPQMSIKRLLKERGVTDISELDHEDCLNLLSMLRFDNMNLTYSWKTRYFGIDIGIYNRDYMEYTSL